MVEAVEAMVEKSDFGPEYAAYVAGLRMLAAELDVGADDKLWREFRMLLKDFREAASSGGSGDSEYDRLSRELAELATES